MNTEDIIKAIGVLSPAEQAPIAAALDIGVEQILEAIPDLAPAEQLRVAAALSRVEHLDGDGVAESPFERWPGRLVFPSEPTARHYVELMAAVKKRDKDPHDPLLLIPYWRGLLAVATVEVDGIDVEAPVEEQPPAFLKWAHDATNEYYRNFILRGA